METKNIVAYRFWSKKENNRFVFGREYYAGYLSLPIFGKAAKFVEKIEEAKRFSSKKEAIEELEKIGRDVEDFKIEKMEVQENE